MNRLKRLALEILGWVLVAVGLAGLVLPGPGLITIVAGLVLLAREYDWARRHLEPIRLKALQGARESVSSPTRIGITLAGIVWLAFFGILWCARPPAPDWWTGRLNLRESWWLLGGWGTGLTLLFSAALALTAFVWSWRRFRTVTTPPTEE